MSKYRGQYVGQVWKLASLWSQLKRLYRYVESSFEMFRKVPSDVSVPGRCLPGPVLCSPSPAWVSWILKDILDGNDYLDFNNWITSLLALQMDHALTFTESIDHFSTNWDEILHNLFSYRHLRVFTQNLSLNLQAESTLSSVIWCMWLTFLRSFAVSCKTHF